MIIFDYYTKQNQIEIEKDKYKKRENKKWRKLEEKIALKIIKKRETVIALGGGAFINENIRKKVLQSCVSVWLKVNLDKLIKRYRTNNRRPLLNKTKLDADVRKIYHLRKKIYSLANFKISCDNMSKTQIVERILVLYEN